MAALDLVMMKSNDVTDAYISEHWQDTDLEGNTLFAYAIKKELNFVIGLCLNNEHLSEMILQQCEIGGTVFHIAAEKLNSDDFKVLVENASEEAINAGVVKTRNFLNQTVLYLAAAYQSPEAVMALVNKASPEAINAMMLASSTWLSSILSALVHKLPIEGMLCFLDKVSTQALEHQLSLKDYKGEGDLHWVLARREPVLLNKILHKISKENIMTILLAGGKDGRGVFQYAALNTDTDIFDTLLNFISDYKHENLNDFKEDINQAMSHVDQWCGNLTFLLRLLKEKQFLSFYRLVDIISPETMNDVMWRRFDKGESIMDELIRAQHDICLNAVIDKSCTGKWESYQSIMSKLLSTIKPENVEWFNGITLNTNAKLVFALKYGYLNIAKALLDYAETILFSDSLSPDRAKEVLAVNDFLHAVATDDGINYYGVASFIIGDHELFVRSVMLGVPMSNGKTPIEFISNQFQEAIKRNDMGTMVHFSILLHRLTKGFPLPSPQTVIKMHYNMIIEHLSLLSKEAGKIEEHEKERYYLSWARELNEHLPTGATSLPSRADNAFLVELITALLKNASEMEQQALDAGGTKYLGLISAYSKWLDVLKANQPAPAVVATAFTAYRPGSSTDNVINERADKNDNDRSDMMDLTQ